MKNAWMMAALALVCAPAWAAVRPDAWSTVFAAEHDTVVFFGLDGTLLRAPFSMATRETLWTPPQDQRLVRLCVSPDGTRAAWITRAFDHDTTRLWVHGPEGTALIVRYFALQPRHHGYVHSEPSVPSVEDRGARGGRLVHAGALMRRNASNTLAWTPDSRTIVFGYDGGVAARPVGGGSGFGAGKVAPVSLEALDPSPMFLVDAIDLKPPPHQSPSPVDQLDLERAAVIDSRKNAPGRAHYLLYLTHDQWRVYGASDLAESRVRAASPRTVWWATHQTVRAIRVDDPDPTVEFRAADDVVWLGFDGSRRALLWVAGRHAGRKPEDGGPETIAFGTGSPVRAAFASRTSGSVAMVTDDSLLVWSPADDRLRRFDRAGLDPCALHEGPEDRLLVAVDCDHGGQSRLARADAASGRLVVMETPKLKGGMLRAIGDGSWILLFDPAPKPPRTLWAYDVRKGVWSAVENPGVSGWEPLGSGE